MNEAETIRNSRIAAMHDSELLEKLISDAYAADLRDGEFDAFLGMHLQIQRGGPDHRDWRLTRKQRAWAEEVARRVFPISTSAVPRGRPVPTPGVLQNLPKRPPGR